MALDHLGRDVARRARRLDELAVAPRDADVHQHAPRAERIADDVPRLDVAVDDPAIVERVERRGDLIDHRDDLGERHRGALDAVAIHRLLHPLALDELHHEVRVAAALPEVEDLDQVRVLEPREHRRLAPQVLHERRVLGQVRAQHLDRHRPLEREVLGAVDHAHAAAADLVQEPVRAAERRAQLVADHVERAARRAPTAPPLVRATTMPVPCASSSSPTPRARPAG